MTTCTCIDTSPSPTDNRNTPAEVAESPEEAAISASPEGGRSLKAESPSHKAVSSPRADELHKTVMANMGAYGEGSLETRTQVDGKDPYALR